MTNYFAGRTYAELERCCEENKRKLEAAEKLLAAGALSGVTEAICEIADAEGLKDSDVIPIWPKATDMERMGPQLTVGAVRELSRAIEAYERGL